MELIKRFEKNTQGRDFVVGDIHGMFSMLEEKLSEVGFNKNRDRLFCVGDLVDRGPESDMADHYILREKWFHSVRGNHEQMLIDAMDTNGRFDAAGMHFINGGQWFYGLPEVEQQCIALVLEELPLAFEVETDKGLVGIIHAEVPFGDWELFKSLYTANVDHCEAVALWARSKLSRKDQSVVRGIDRVYVGHTYVPYVTQLGNVYYMDTGACFGEKMILRQIQ
ncbi:Serine/threonine-protein phosphatase 1 [compost metagenome]